MKCAKHVAHMGGKCKVMEQKSDESTPLGRARGRWKDNIQMALKWEGVDWINLAQDGSQWQAVMNPVMNLDSIKW